MNPHSRGLLSVKIKWATSALEDLRSLHADIADDNPIAASNVVSKIRAAARMLGSHPNIGRIGRVAGTRKLVIGGTPFVAV